MATPNQFVLRTPDGHEYPITDLAKVGRDATNAIPLNDPSASRHHASLWVQAAKLYLRDENSANGVFVNDKRIPADKPYALKNGDRIRIGKSDLIVGLLRASPTGTVILPAARPAQRWPLLTASVALLVFGLGILCVVPLAGYFLLGWSIPELPGLAGNPPVTRVNTSHINISTPPPPLAASQYADKSHGLAALVASLNDSELIFIRHAHANPSGRLGILGVLALLDVAADSTFDSELSEIAANAMQVCTIADALSYTTAAQDGASESAGKVAGQYVSMAQLTCALVIDAQNIRRDLSNGSITPPEAAATVADYGARLWNPSVIDEAGANPFTALLANPASIPSAQFVGNPDINTLLGAPTSLAWTAVSGQPESKTLTLDSRTLSAAPVDRHDPALLTKLTTVQGQKDNPQSAQLLAGAVIAAGASTTTTNAGANTMSSGQVQATFQSASAVSSNETPTRNNTLPTFPGGAANATTSDSNGDVVTTLLGVSPDNTPSVESQTPVNDLPAAVTLGIGDVVIKEVQKESGLLEAKVTLAFDVSWQTTIASPQIPISCNSQSVATVTTSSGSAPVTATYNLILYPGNAYLSCVAGNSGRYLGSVEASVLVGDAAEATQRVNQVETSYSASGLTSEAQIIALTQTQAAGPASTQSILQTENAISTEVIGTQTAEFRATITEIARQTEKAPTPAPTETPLPTATFTPVLVDTFFHPGDIFSVTSNITTVRGHLYRVCLGGTVNLTTGPAEPSDIDHVNGILVPASGCVVIEGDGKVIVVTCGTGEPEEEPGGFTIQVFDLGPS